MRLLITTLCLGLLFAGCQRMDSFLYNPDNTIEEYLLDDFVLNHHSFFKLDSSYDIPDSLIHVFTLPNATEHDIYAFYIGDINRIQTDTIIMYNHGNFGHMDVYWQRVKLLANCGGKNRFGVMMIDYSGFGLSGGTANEENLYHDVNLGLEWLSSNGLTEDRLIMYGFSLGTAPSCELTNKPRSLQASKLILEAPFASDDIMIQDGAVINMPGSFLSNLEIDNAEEIKTIEEPLLWLHGTMDDFVNIGHGELVYENHNGSFKEEIRIEGAEHSTCPQTIGFEDYNQIILEFILR